jgi:hypothetical protein
VAVAKQMNNLGEFLKTLERESIWLINNW